MEFVHLHVNTEFSLLKGAAKIDLLIEQAKTLNYTAIAITDINTLYGVVPFYKACKRAGIKPIIGLELMIKSSDQLDSRLILLAKNIKGYQNIVKLSSVAQVYSHRGEVSVEQKYLRAYCDGLIAISSAYKGEIQTLLEKNKEEEAYYVHNIYKQIYGNDFYVSIHDHSIAEEKQLNLKIMKFASKYDGVNLVVTNQVMYIHKDDALAHRCLQAIDQGTTLNELKSDFVTDEYYLKSKESMIELFAHIPEAVKNSVHIAHQCNVEISFHNYVLPKFPLPHGENAKDYLYKLCLQGLKKRFSTLEKQYEDRLQYELNVIDQMQFNDYFLIVWDFMKYAHDHHILTGPGRGSAAGSLVAYALNITNVDPIKYDLLFERFLNPERITMPDIDIDFPDTRREEVIDYVYRKYGKNHVAQIITFGTLAAKAALRDVGKVMGIPLKQIDRVAKLISSRPNLTIDMAIEESEELRSLLKNNDEMKKWIILAKRVEGIPRHASTHAAGIVISRDPLTDLVPVQKGHNEVLLTQYPMYDLEELGLLKMDFLGLRNLSFIEEILESIKRVKKENVNINEIPFNDQKTFELLSKGDTLGIFQLESPGMRRVLQKLKPTSFEDIVAVNALYRPGPMENIPVYIDGKHKRINIHYIHEDLIPILNKTYGVIVYQEQIMQIAAKLAGFSLGEADILRRAVSKKKRDVLEKQRERFVNGCLMRNYPIKVANDVYDLIVRFADYGFNRSHSVAYSVISYQLAYLKANYSTAFYAALLTSAIGNNEKVNHYIATAKQKGIVVHPPSINRSNAGFSLSENNDIQFGLAAIKNIGYKMIEEIILERNRHGQYVDLFDLCARVQTRLLNRRSLESLVAAGALDEFTDHRASMLASLDDAIEYGEKINATKESKQTLLFDEEIKKPRLLEVPPFKEMAKLYFEKEVLGFYLSSHPIESFAKILLNYGRITILNAVDEKANITVRLAGLIEKIRIVNTKKGEQMAFIRLSDESGEMEVTVFPKSYRQYYQMIKEGELVFLEGKLEMTESRTQVILSKISDVKNLKRMPKKVFIKLEKEQMKDPIVNKLKNILKLHRGNCHVFLYYEEKKQIIQLSDDYKISASNQCLQQLIALLGRENIVVKE